MTKLRGDRSTLHPISSVHFHSVQDASAAMGARLFSNRVLDLGLLAVCSCLLTLLCHSLTHPHLPGNTSAMLTSISSAKAETLTLTAKLEGTAFFYLM